jgi:hypothetical protein
MLDLETLDTRPTAAIRLMAAVRFDPVRGIVSPDCFCERISPSSCEAVGLTYLGDTILWWLQQSEAARTKMTAGDETQLRMVLLQFTGWFSRSYPAPTRIWSHGVIFDVVIAENAFRACELPVPWDHRAPRDTRTLFDLAGIDMKDFPADVPHDPLSDALAQVQAVCEAYRRLGLAEKSASA